MSGFEVLPPITDPVALAAKRAEERALATDGFDMTPEDERTLAELDVAADMLGFIGSQYFIHSNRSLSVPASFKADKETSYINFMGLTFEGDFACYSKVHIGRLIGGTSIRALCLTFHNVTLLPYFDSLPNDHLLHVPVLAVDSIDKQAA